MLRISGGSTSLLIWIDSVDDRSGLAFLQVGGADVCSGSAGIFDVPSDEVVRRLRTIRGRTMMRLRLNLMSGFTLTTSLIDLAATAVRSLMAELKQPISPRARADESSLTAISKGVRTKGPNAEERHCPLAFAGAHFRRNPPGYPRVVYHDCRPLNDHVSQCLILDGPGPDARLIGVEYLVSDEVYRRMPAEERIYWHDHQYEADAGLLTSPTRSGVDEAPTFPKVSTLWGKVYHTWASGGDYPRGPAAVLWSDTGELPFVLPPGAPARTDIC
jgi:hypothetical protein